MTKEEVLQKANDYCTEKAYTSETLTDAFKDKFADFFVKRNPDGDIADENVLADLHFNLDTAFSATSKGITAKVQAFETKEADLNNQIAELKKQIGGKQTPPPAPTIPQEVQDQIAELKQYKETQAKQEKRREVIAAAKKGVRADLHETFDTYAKDYVANLEEDVDAQAKKLTSRFQELFRSTIGDIKPLTPQQSQKRDQDILDSVSEVKVV